MGREVFGANRRQFLGGAGALVIGATIAARAGKAAALATDGSAPLAPNAFVRVDPDGTVTVIVKHIEFGQGPMTGLATLVADEMDADWSQMRAELAPAGPAFVNSAFGMQGTGGSTAMPSSWEPMRKAGAQARAVLLAAAAEAWNVPVAELSITTGRITHAGSGRVGGFGDFAAAASALPVPESPSLKSAEQRTLIGQSLPKLDTLIKTNGEARFTMDVFRDGLLTVSVVHPPAFGATLSSFDEAAALRVPGVVAVKRVPSGIAVYGEDTFAAFRGRDAVQAEWDEADAETRTSNAITSEFVRLAAQPGSVAVSRGDLDTRRDASVSRVETTFTFPFLAHTPMEPLDAVLERKEDGSVEAWMGTQLQTVDHQTIAGVLGVPPERVQLNTMLAGGSFGRRAQPTSHFAAEAAEVLKSSPEGRPVKLVWTREDDVRGGYYRPLTVHRIDAGMDEDGGITDWDQTIVTPSFIDGSPFQGMIPENGIDPTITEGAAETAYDIPNKQLSVHQAGSKVPTLWWRSVGHTHTGYVLETVIDELLEGAGRDAVEGRLALMKDPDGRDAGVLRRAAEVADWGRSLPDDRRLGVAVHKSFGTYVANVAEVSMEGTLPKVHKVWAAVDCGVAVNPNVIAAQIEGGIGFGLGAVLFDEITLGEGGRVRQANWDEYRMIRLHEMPAVEVSIVESQENPTGVGEPGVPCIGPAMANAVRHLTGRRINQLPVLREVLA